MAAPSYAFVTLVSSDSYLPGALAVAGALKDVHPSPALPPEVPFQTACLVTPETVDVSTIKHLRKAFDIVIGVEVIGQEDETGLTLLGRLDLKTVLTKLHIFRLTQFSKIIFLDADVLPIRPLSHLFSLPHEFSASPDVGWPDIFNSGVLVLSPGEDKFTQLTDLLKSKGSWDGGDQGLLNEWRGQNWNRLSFTYNTTPTAAYTYAPAYERFGSQISAIHFIGPNKPWNSLAYRTPFSGQSAPASAFSQEAYDYNALIDRWYAVYDKHYRSQGPSPQAEFELTRYESAWNEPGGGKTSSVSLPAGSTLSLDELRRLAIEGMNAQPQMSSRDLPSVDESVQGAYQSLPLEGRVDLMRLKTTQPKEGEDWVQEKGRAKEQKKPEPLKDLSTNKEEPHILVARFVGLPEESAPELHALPTPGPDEIPPSPRPRIIALPPITPTPQPAVQRYQAPDGPSHHEQEQEPHEHEKYEHPLPPSEPYREPQQQPQPEPHTEPPRPHSPTMVMWNPAVEPPPTTMPASSTFPADTYFPNIWDAPHSKQNDQPYQPHQISSPMPESGSFFEPLPQPEIPEPLIKQGHYRNVTGENAPGATPSPDRSKVKHVFPWEEKPRHMPGRVFPAADSPRPSLFLSPESQTSSELPTTPESKPRRLAPTLSPLYGLPSSLTYTNAWDTVPSIQKYASRLVRPHPPRALAPAFDEDGWDTRGSKSWDEKAEASSRDGDVEDEGDESADEEAPEDSLYSEASDTESVKALQRRSRRGSSLAETRTIGEPVKQYRSLGVQTFTPEMRSQAVQVDTELLKPDIVKESAPEKRPTVSGRRQLAPSTRPRVSPSTITHEFGTEIGPSLAPPGPSPTVGAPRPSGISGLVSPLLLGSRSQQPLPASSTGARPSKITTPALKQVMRAPGSPSIQSPVVTRQASNDSSLGSPASSAGPISPPDSQPISSAARKGGRVWDPARGVELFKRGSEEVLARFLKMGSWEDENL
ncbi:Glycogenin-1 [Hypsizygus marmoreus]|uniref:glycogenin glucosyltransferase n=1 Tax=Hypsizygus marmoreus TaxID=39966 RepID=A0A369K411_HYPMA|nr:Glycogenin-1 [Hypsizygus marmoreus]